MADQLRFVIIGSGNIANTYMEALRRVPEARVAGIVSRAGKRPTRLGEAADGEVRATLREIAACRKAGVTLGVCFQRRMSPDNVAVKALLTAGKLGRVYAADLSVKFFREQAYYDSAPYRGGWAIDGMDNPSHAPAGVVHSGAGAAGAMVSDTAGHEAIIADFIRAVRERRPPAVTGEDARLTTELILQIHAAARK